MVFIVAKVLIFSENIITTLHKFLHTYFQKRMFIAIE